MLPPPTTITTSTPSSRTSPIWRAISWIDSGQMPTPDSPPSASPLSLSRMREYLGLGGLVINRQGCSNRPGASQFKDRHSKADETGGQGDNSGGFKKRRKQERGQPCPRELDLMPATRGHGCPRSNLEATLGGERDVEPLGKWGNRSLSIQTPSPHFPITPFPS